MSQSLLKFCLLSQWCHPTISPSVALFSSCPQSFPASGSFPISWLFTSGGQSIRASAPASVLPTNIQGSFPLGLTGFISLLSKGLSRVLQHHKSKASVLQCSAFFMAQLSHSYMTTGEAIDLTIWIFVDKICLCFLICCLDFSYKIEIIFEVQYMPSNDAASSAWR